MKILKNNELGINFFKYKYKHIYKKNNIPLDLTTELASFESFVTQKNNYILGVKIFFTSLDFFEIFWSYRYRAIAAAIIENELEGPFFNFFPERIIVNNDKCIWNLTKNVEEQENLNINLLNYILNSEGSCKIFGDIKYMNFVSQNVWFLIKDNKIYLEEELIRQKKFTA